MSKTNTLLSPADAVDERSLAWEKPKLWRDNKKTKDFLFSCGKGPINDGSVTLGRKVAGWGSGKERGT
jgi:hypothetical protein